MKDDALKTFEAELRAQHATLTAAHDDLQARADALWAEYEAAKAALTTFRAQYGRVLRALDESPAA